MYPKLIEGTLLSAHSDFQKSSLRRTARPRLIPSRGSSYFPLISAIDLMCQQPDKSQTDLHFYSGGNSSENKGQSTLECLCLHSLGTTPYVPYATTPFRSI